MLLAGDVERIKANEAGTPNVLFFECPSLVLTTKESMNEESKNQCTNEPRGNQKKRRSKHQTKSQMNASPVEKQYESLTP